MMGCKNWRAGVLALSCMVVAPGVAAQAWPERPLRRLSLTSARLLPMLETMPMPVTTTRRIRNSPSR